MAIGMQRRGARRPQGDRPRLRRARLRADAAADRRRPAARVRRLAASGGFSPLGTTIPPQSPVAWSTFITGLDPGEHGIFDFVHRDPKTMEPYLSTTSTEPARSIGAGRWQLPLGSGRVESLRHGQPFWEVLEARGIPTTVIRMPANFPPSGTATRELSGMGTPDLLGRLRHLRDLHVASRTRRTSAPPGGAVYPVAFRDGLRRSRARRPGQSLSQDGREASRADSPRAAIPRAGMCC